MSLIKSSQTSQAIEFLTVSFAAKLDPQAQCEPQSGASQRLTESFAAAAAAEAATETEAASSL